MAYINAQQASTIKTLDLHRVNNKVSTLSITKLPEINQDYIEMCANESIPMEVQLKSTIIDLRVTLDATLEENKRMREAMMLCNMQPTNDVLNGNAELMKKYKVYNLILMRSLAVYYLDKVVDESTIKYTYSIINELNSSLTNLGIDPYDHKYIIPIDHLHQFDINSIDIKGNYAID